MNHTPFVGFVGLVSLAAVILTILFVLPRYTCEANWRDSGMAWRWSFLGGCQVQRADLWIPAGAYREILQQIR